MYLSPQVGKFHWTNKKLLWAPTRGPSWLGNHFIPQKVAGLIRSQGTHLGWRFNSQLGHVWEAVDNTPLYLGVSVLFTKEIIIKVQKPESATIKRLQKAFIHSCMLSVIHLTHLSSMFYGLTRGFQAEKWQNQILFLNPHLGICLLI